MNRLLITGGSGYLGQHLIEHAEDWEVTATYHARAFTPIRGAALQLDLRDEAATRAAIAELKPQAILHAACSNRNAEHQTAIVPAARHIARTARALNIHLVHVSSDVVFDGEHPPYGDAARPQPITDYARAKAEAEDVVADICPNAVIARPSLIWGLDPIDHQTRWLAEAARNGQPVTLFTDEFRCPTYVHDLAKALLELAARVDVSGPLNLVGPQRLSRWDFGVKLLAALNVSLTPNVMARTVKESGLMRPRDLTLTTERAQRELKTRLRSVDEVLGSG
ncbi:MAG: SDR family oxidoreductase [Anaerolineales bacterium]